MLYTSICCLPNGEDGRKQGHGRTAVFPSGEAVNTTVATRTVIRGFESLPGSTKTIGATTVAVRASIVWFYKEALYEQ